MHSVYASTFADYMNVYNTPAQGIQLVVKFQIHIRMFIQVGTSRTVDETLLELLL